MLLGPVWKAISPSRTINAVLARISGSDPEVGMYAYPERLGYWPAAIGLYAFVWLELVYPYSTEIGPVRLWCAIYIGVMLIGGALFGNRFYERADPFEVYSSLVAKLSVWGHRDGRLVVRSPLANLDTVPVAPGLVAVVAVLFGSTAYDSFKDASPGCGSSRRRRSPPASSTTSRCSSSAWAWGSSSRPAAWRPAWDPTSVARRCPTSSRTRWSRSSSATSSPTT